MLITLWLIVLGINVIRDSLTNHLIGVSLNTDRFVDWICLKYEPASAVKQVAHILCVGKVIGSMLGPNCVIAKDVKSCT